MAAPSQHSTLFQTSADLDSNVASAISRAPFALGSAASSDVSVTANDLINNPFAYDASLMAFQLDGHGAFASAPLPTGLSLPGNGDKGQAAAKKTLEEGESVLHLDP